MSDSYISIVPGLRDYPDRYVKAQEILFWLVEKDIVKKELSDCTLGPENGYAISDGARSVVDEPEYLPYELIVNGLEIITELQVFHPGEFWDDDDGNSTKLPESDLGFTFWNWPTFKDSFLKEFRRKLNCEIEIVIGRI